MTEFVNVPKPGLERLLAPQAIVLLDPSDGSALGSAANPVHVLSTSAAAVATADRELLVAIYRCKTAFTGASVGDTITATRVLDVGGAAVSQVGATLWRNESTGQDLTSAPAASTLEITGTPGLSDAQLRASPVPVSVGNFPGSQAVTGNFYPATQTVSGTVAVSNLPATQPMSATALPLPSGAATAANQATEINSLGSIDNKLTKGTAAKAASLSVTFATDAQTDTIGRVGALCAQPTASAITCTAASAYASGNAVGGLVTITGAVRAGVLTGLLQSVKVTSASAQAASTFDVFLFASAPTAPTDKTAYTIATADLPKLITVVHCTDTITAGGTVHLADRCAQPFLATTTSIYAVVVVRGTPTFTAATDVALSISVVQD